MTLGCYDLFYGKIKHRKMIEHKISWKVLKIFVQKCSNDDLGLTVRFFMARSNLLSGLSYGKDLWKFYNIWVQKLFNAVK